MSEINNEEIDRSNVPESIQKEIEELNASSEKIIDEDISKINHKTILDRFDEYLDGEEMSETKARIFRIVSVAGMAATMGASLAGCKNAPDEKVKEKDFISKSTPIAEVVSAKNWQEIPQNIVSYENNKVIRYEDLNLQDIEIWKELTPEKVEKTEKIIQTTAGSEVILIPVQQDYFYNKKEKPTIWKVPAGINLEIKDIYYFKGEDEKIARFSILPNAMASKSIPVIFLDNGHMEGEEYIVDGKNYEETNASQNFSEFSYIVGKDEVYPNKIVNVLTAMEGIAQNQEKNGKFIKGQEYSYLDLIGLKNLGNYRDGFTSSKAIVKGGGVCAGATLMSNTLYELGVNGNVAWDDIVVEKWAHPSMYFVGPFSINDFVTDATVQLSNNPAEKNYDFRWIQPKDAYLKIDISMIPNGLNIQETESSGIGGKSDIEFMVSLSFVDSDPGNQSQKIREFISAYDEYRKSGHMNITSLLSQGKYLSEIEWENPTYGVIMDYVYPEEKLEYFKEEMESGGYISQIRDLQDIVNALPTSFSGNLGEYLKTTDWYENVPNKESVAGALGMLNYTKVEGQPLQCVGFVTLLAGLKYDELNIQNVGGASSFGTGESSAKTAAELIPYKLISDRFAEIASTGYGGIAFGSENMEINDYQVGDLFVRGDIGRVNNGISPTGEKMTFNTGHIGAIIGKKIVDGEVVLLVADANRKNDGKIKIFEVTENNFYKIFGDPGVKKFIIRAASK